MIAWISKFLIASYILDSYKFSYIIVLKFLYVRTKCVFSFVYFSYYSVFLESCRIQLYYVMLCVRNCLLLRKLN